MEILHPAAKMMIRALFPFEPRRGDSLRWPARTGRGGGGGGGAATRRDRSRPDVHGTSVPYNYTHRLYAPVSFLSVVENKSQKHQCV